MSKNRVGQCQLGDYRLFILFPVSFEYTDQSQVVVRLWEKDCFVIQLHANAGKTAQRFCSALLFLSKIFRILSMPIVSHFFLVFPYG